MKTILVATDLSKTSHNACLYAIDMAKELKADIILLHVFETPLLFAGQYYTVYHELAEKKLKDYHHKIAAQAGTVKITMAIQHGLPSARIVELALEKKADLIVIGTTGNGAVARIFLGNNALRIFRHANCPVLAIPSGSQFKGMHKIVYTTDLQKDNLSSAALLIPFASEFNAEIVFLNVSGAIEKEDFKNDTLELTKQIKKHFTYQKTSGYLCNNLDASEGINYFIKHHAVDCLAIYTHQRNLLSQIFGESVTKRILLHTKTPLLIIPEKN